MALHASDADDRTMKEAQAAIRIQSAYRGKSARVDVSKAKAADAALSSEEVAAVKLQSAYRGHEARRGQQASSLASSALLAAVVEARDRPDLDLDAASDAVERLSDDAAVDLAVRLKRCVVFSLCV